MLRVFSILFVFVVSACETTREVSNQNLGPSSSATFVEDKAFDKKVAAEKRVNFGLTYISTGNYQRAKVHLDKALSYAPDFGDVHYALGIYYQRVKDKKESEKYFKKALKIEPNRPEYLNAYGAFKCEKGEFKAADDLFQQAINIPTYSDIAMVFYNVGFCALKQNDVVKAETFFRKSLNRDSQRPGALFEMAKIEFDKNRYERSMSYLKRFEQFRRVTPESALLGLKASYYLKDKDAFAKYELILEQRFPDSEATAIYLDNKQQWM